jgi:hypothetical protein
VKVTLDFETANRDQSVSLDEMGSYAYFEHPMTEVLCLYAITDSSHEFCWLPGVNDDVLNTLRRWAIEWDVIFECHGASFEQAGWEHVLVRKYGLPRLPPERWSDTQAVCYYRGLPAGLDRAARIMGVTEEKDMEGSKLTISLSKPMTRKVWMELKPPTSTTSLWKSKFYGAFDRRPETIRRVVAYCRQDRDRAQPGARAAVVLRAPGVGARPEDQPARAQD